MKLFVIARREKDDDSRNRLDYITQSKEKAECRAARLKECGYVTEVVSEDDMWQNCDTLEEKISKLFELMGVFYEFEVTRKRILVDVELGDWKHDHIWLDEVMTSAFDEYLIADEIVTEEDGSDCYSATHQFIKRKGESE